MKDVNITVRIDQERLSKMDLIISDKKITRSELIRRAIDDYIRIRSMSS
jgi:metal-responsive CopG/Arc/MetJ family transcriptional regulator